MKGFARVTRLSNIVGRADYISNPGRQESIVAVSDMINWKPYHDYEIANQKNNRQNNDGREVIISIPNEWDKLDRDELTRRVQQLAVTAAGKDTDMQWAVHWNKAHTNLHVHVIFSERQREKEPGRWDRDIYLTNDGKVARRKADRARNPDGSIKPPVHRKGEPKGGFTAKDPKYATRAWVPAVKAQIETVLQRYGVQLEAPEPLHQYHEGKGRDASVIHLKNTIIKENNRRLAILKRQGIDIPIGNIKKAIKAGKMPIIRYYKGEIVMYANTDLQKVIEQMKQTAKQFAPAQQQNIQQLQPRDLAPLVAAIRDLDAAMTSVNMAEKRIPEERPVNRSVLQLPETLQRHINDLENAFFGRAGAEKTIQQATAPVKPGIFASRARKEEYARYYQDYRDTIDRAKATKAEYQDKIQKAINRIMPYLDGNEQQKQGYGLNAPVLSAENIERHDLDFIRKTIDFKVSHTFGAAIRKEQQYENDLNQLHIARSHYEDVKSHCMDICRNYTAEEIEAASKAIAQQQKEQPYDDHGRNATRERRHNHDHEDR